MAVNLRKEEEKSIIPTQKQSFKTTTVIHPNHISEKYNQKKWSQNSNKRKQHECYNIHRVSKPQYTKKGTNSNFQDAIQEIRSNFTCEIIKMSIATMEENAYFCKTVYNQLSNHGSSNKTNVSQQTQNTAYSR